MKRTYYIAIMILFFSVSLFAQDRTQAYRFSQLYPVGTARYSAMGGALGAMGGDFTSASTNPAGLGIYRNSEFTFTPTYHVSTTNTNFLSNSSQDHASNISIANLGFVSANKTGRDNGIISTTWAFGYNMLNDFNSSFTMQGVQAAGTGSSLLDNFVNMANSSATLDPYYEGLAYEASAMPWGSDISTPDPDDNAYWHNFQTYPEIGYTGYGQEQLRVVERSGNVGEYAFSGAMNIDNKVFLGATLGIHSVRYYEDITHIETDLDDLEPEINSFEFGEYNSTRGYGYALKLGMILRPIQRLRIGASFHAPVKYHLTDEKFSEFYSYFDSNAGIDNAYASSGMNAKEYTLSTPARASLSAALLFGKLGMLTAEYEYVNYSFADLDSPGYDFDIENIAISKDFTVAHNLKAGAELRLGSLYCRGGLQYYTNPFSNKENGSNIMVYTAGLGVRSGQTFIDFSYSIRNSDELYGLYALSDEIVIAETSFKSSNAMITLGYKF